MMSEAETEIKAVDDIGQVIILKDNKPGYHLL
jgi:hypothetical protein